MSLYNDINKVMDQFDFDKVHRVMKFLDWRWAGTQPGGAVPTIEDLKSTAYMCLSVAVNNHLNSDNPAAGTDCSTGGFTAAVDVYEHTNARLSLLFYVDRACT